MPSPSDYSFAPQGCTASPEALSETLTAIHDETAKTVYQSIEVLTAILSRVRGSQPSGNSAGEKCDRTVLRDAQAIRAGTYAINTLASQLAGLI